MLFLNKRSLILVALLLSSGSVFAVENPFNVNFDLDKRTTSEGTFQLIKVSISSRSSEDSNYLLKVNIPETNIKFVDGKKVFTGVLGPLRSDDFYITVKGVVAGEGEINAKAYVSLDGNSIDTATAREFYANYLVKKVNDDFEISIVKTGEKQNTGAAKQDARSDQTTIEQMKDTAQAIAIDDTSQKFVINSGNRYNDLLRSLLFVLSFFVVGYLLHMIVKKKK